MPENNTAAQATSRLFKLNLMLHGKWHEPLIEVDIIKNEAYSYMYLGLEAMCNISEI